MRAILLLCLLSLAAADYGFAGENPISLSGNNRCPPGKVFSPVYGGGTCVCEVPEISGFFTGVGGAIFGTTITSQGMGDFIINEQLFNQARGGAFSYTDNGNTISFGNMTFIWDVIACEYVPVCPDGFIWSGLERRCICDVPIDCQKLCREQYRVESKQQIVKRDDPKIISNGGSEILVRESVSDYQNQDESVCEFLRVDPGTCQCVKRCNDTANCIPGYTFDQEKCQCVPSRCKVSYLCSPGSVWDEQLCQCVKSQFCPNTEPTICVNGFVYDNVQCRCALPQCPRTQHPIITTNGQVECVPDCPVVTPCLLGQVFDAVACTCQNIAVNVNVGVTVPEPICASTSSLNWGTGQCVPGVPGPAGVCCGACDTGFLNPNSCECCPNSCETLTFPESGCACVPV